MKNLLASLPEPEPMVDKDRAVELIANESDILSEAQSRAAAGDDSLLVHLAGHAYAASLQDAHEVIADRLRITGDTENSRYHQNLGCNAEQLKLHHLDLLESLILWNNRQD